MSQSNLNLATKSTGPVECLGQKFPSEEARREHYLKLLAQKLKDPEFRKIEGFPIGKDEDILALSDPPYYTACPNPWLGEFIKDCGTVYDPKQPYHRQPFVADVSEGKTHPIYLAHAYHTKVPHRAIMRYILHYTQPGEVVLDGFCGTGMTGVAAQLCGDRAEVQELGYRVQEDGTILNDEGKPFSKLGARRAILNDLSPAATFIAYNYNTPVDPQAFQTETKRILNEVETDCGWMYQTHVPNSQRNAQFDYTVWSETFTCPECAGEIIFLNAAMDDATKRVNDTFACPNCRATLTKDKVERVMEKWFDTLTNQTKTRPKRVPVLIAYKDINGKREKKPDASDIALIANIEQTPLRNPVPVVEFRFDDMWEAPRLRSRGVSHVHHMYTARTLRAASALWAQALALPDRRLRSATLFAVDQAIIGLSLLNRYQPIQQGRPGGSQVNRQMTGAYYMPSQISECTPSYNLAGKVKRLAIVFAELRTAAGACSVSTGSASALALPSNSLDYLFLDPPFGDNYPYAELNLMVEAWYRVITNSSPEAIVDRSKKNTAKVKSLEDYLGLMRNCFREAYRVLKPGRWLTVEFSNTKASVWNAIQSALQEVGFVVAHVAALDKQQGSFKAVTTTTAVKQDLVISAYKPNGGLEERFAKRGETEEGVWDFMRTHLRNLPIVKARGGQLEFVAERDPRILYDRMVSFYVGHTTPVPINSAEFQAGLAEKFPERDGMFFLPEQVNEYDKKRAQVENIGQLVIFVEDERSAIGWLRGFLKDRPSTSQDIQPEFMQQLGASWKKWETRPEMSSLLDQNFLCYDGTGEVPSQIHGYLSTQFKELRNLPKDHAQLKAKAKNRWYVPDPKKNVDVETLRNKHLLDEFWSYLPEGYSPPAFTANKGQTLPGLTVPRPKIPKGKKLKELRTEAVRVGFKHCYQQKDYTTILVVAEMLPESVLNEDEQLQMIYDTAVTRTGGAD